MNAVFYVLKPATRAPELIQAIESIHRAVQALAGPLAIARFVYISGGAKCQ